MTQQQLEIVQDDGPYEPIFVARQPIFTREEDIWGYELLFRHSGTAGGAMIGDPDEATAKVIADGISLALTDLPHGKRFLINFPTGLLLKETALALPKESCIVEILETVDPTPEIIAALGQLKAEGYTLALDDFVGQPGFEEIIKMADIIKVEVMGMPPAELIKLTQVLKRFDVELLCEKVEDEKTLQLAKSLGYRYFQGYYFSKPEIVPGRKISSGEMAKIQLLNELSRKDFEFKNLAQIISHDTGLSYRLLQFINSAAFATAQTIQSVEQALPLLGFKPLKQWLMVVMLADMNPSPKARELTVQSVGRARYLELLAEAMPKPPYPGATMFMLGLFSKLDALLNQPMEDITAQLPLDEAIRAALNGEKNEAHGWLDLLDHTETGAWDEATAFLEQHGLNPAECAEKHILATKWAKVMAGQGAAAN